MLSQELADLIVRRDQAETMVREFRDRGMLEQELYEQCRVEGSEFSAHLSSQRQAADAERARLLAEANHTILQMQTSSAQREREASARRNEVQQRLEKLLAQAREKAHIEGERADAAMRDGIALTQATGWNTKREDSTPREVFLRFERLATLARPGPTSSRLADGDCTPRT